MSFVYNFYQYFIPNGVDLQTNLFKRMCPYSSSFGEGFRVRHKDFHDLKIKGCILVV